MQQADLSESEETTLPPNFYIPLCTAQVNTCTNGPSNFVNLFMFLNCTPIDPPATSVSTATKFKIPMTLMACPDSDCHNSSACVAYNTDPIGMCNTPNFDIAAIYIINGWDGQFSPISCPPSPSGCPLPPIS